MTGIADSRVQVIVGLLAFVVIAITPYVSSAHGGDLKSALKAGYEHSTSLLSEVDMTYSKVQWTDPEFLKRVGTNANARQEFSFHYMATEGKERAEISDRAVPEAKSFRVFDGKYLLSFDPTGQGKDTSTRVGRATRQESDERLSEQMGQPMLFYGYESWCNPSDILDSDKARVEPETKKVGNVLTYEVSAPVMKGGASYIITVWFSATHDCVPVKVQLATDSGAVIKMTEILELGRYDGKWIAKHVRRHEYSNRDGQILEIGRDDYVIEDVLAHPKWREANALFRTDPESLPKGTIYQDAVTGMGFAIGEGMVSEESLSRTLDKAIADLALEPVRAAQSQPDTPNGGRRPLLAGGGIYAVPMGDESWQCWQRPIVWIGLIGGVILVTAGVIAIGRRWRHPGGSKA